MTDPILAMVTNVNPVKIDGLDNYKKPRQDFANRIAKLDDAKFICEAETIIWLAAFANNNPRSDYHWQADACYDEATRRGKPELYTRAYNQAVASCS